MAERLQDGHSLDEREREIFLEALEHPNALERAAYLDRACGSDRELRGTVEALLANHRSDAFLETPVVDAPRLPGNLGPTGTVLVTGLHEKPGDRIGRYKLLQEIGEGACGNVYMAEQEEPVRRRVALKIIKPGMDSKSVIARFEAERQALALMDHPNIAKVFDAGTTETGRPYFVMELVRGIRITEYCDQNHLSTGERLQLFIKACYAVQHAHQKGIIHRDIKPSNILVTLHDGVPVPKVIDFGIAKATEQRLTDKTVFTQFQAFIGTPAYTSPEQAEMSGLDIDTRSDIYSLGVLLYELLTGQTPFDARHLLESGLDEMRRIIREVEPLRPSTRLSTLGMVEATAITRSRDARIPALVQAVRGDLDWIVMKCLEKDRTRRYDTATGLATDIQRYLDSEPVLARPPSTTYRVRKFVHRNRVIVTAATIVTVVLLAGVIVSSWLAVRARQAEREQVQLRRMAEAARLAEAEQAKAAQQERSAALRRAYTSDMNLVQQSLAANNYGRVIDLLNRHRPKSGSSPGEDLRQWEWRYFWNQTQSEAAFALPTQPISLEDMAMSPNGRLLATSDRSGAIKLWDLSTQKEVALIRKPEFGPSSFAFSRDGARLAVVSDHGPRRSTLRIWTVATRQPGPEVPLEAGVESLAFSLDDTRLLTWGRDAAIGVRDAETLQLVSRTPAEPLEDRVRRSSVFSPDAKWLAVPQSGRIRILDAQTGETRSTIDMSEAAFWSLAFSPNGETLAVGPSFKGTSTTIQLFSTANGNELGDLEGHVSWVPGLVFTPDGQRLVSAGADQSIRIWDVATRTELTSLRGHRSEVNCLAIAPDGDTILSGCKDGSILGWNIAHLERKNPFETLPISVNSVEFFPNGQEMLSVNSDGTVTLWHTARLQQTEQISPLGTDVTRVLLSPDGSRLYAGTRSGVIRVLDWATRLVITTNVAGSAPGRFRPGGPGGGGPGSPHGGLGPIGLIDQGQILITAAPGGLIRLLDTASWQIKAEWKISESPPFFWSQLLVSRDERQLLVATSAAVEVRDLFTGQVQATLPAQNWGVTSMAFSPDGDLLAVSSADGTVNLWDASEQALVDVLRGHLLGVNAVRFSPDGERLATLSHGQEAVKLWDVNTRHEVATLAGQGSLFHRVHFSPDGRLIVAINMQKTAYLWRAPSREEIASAENQLQR